MGDIYKDLNKWFGTDPKKRVCKLAEEVAELKEAISKGDVSEIREEVGDVALILYHIADIYETDIVSIVMKAHEKALKRRTDPQYMRKHLHVKQCEFCADYEPDSKIKGLGICNRDNGLRSKASICPYKPVYNDVCAKCGNCKNENDHKCKVVNKRVTNDLPPCIAYEPDKEKFTQNEN